MEPVAQVHDRVAAGKAGLLETGNGGVGAKLVETADEEVDGLVDEGAQLLHGGHGIRHVGHLLLHGVDVLANLGEDIRVLRRGEDRVEVRLVEALARGEDVAGDRRGRERELVRGNANDRSILAVQFDVVQMRAFRGRGLELPETRARS